MEQEKVLFVSMISFKWSGQSTTDVKVWALAPQMTSLWVTLKDSVPLIKSQTLAMPMSTPKSRRYLWITKTQYLKSNDQFLRRPFGRTCLSFNQNLNLSNRKNNRSRHRHNLKSWVVKLKLMMMVEWSKHMDQGSDKALYKQGGLEIPEQNLKSSINLKEKLGIPFWTIKILGRKPLLISSDRFKKNRVHRLAWKQEY